MVFSNTLLMGAIANPATVYTISNAVWFDGSADYLTWTPSGAGDNADKATISVWLKQSTTSHCVYSAETDANNRNTMFLNNNGMQSYQVDSSTVDTNRVASSRNRDPSAWTHYVWRWDSSQAVAGDRCRMYINGVEVSAFDTNTTGTQNRDTHICQAVTQYLGAWSGGSRYNGYMAEFILQDGISSAPTKFGKFDSTGNWVPIDPSVLTFGTNGAWLDFAVAPGTSNGAGTDVSGNGNHWTEVSMTAAQQVTDSPTDDADNNVGNYPTVNVLDSPGGTISNGNLRYVSGSSTWYVNRTTQRLPSTGKFYWEVTQTTFMTAAAGMVIGTYDTTPAGSPFTGESNHWSVYNNNYYNETSPTSTGDTGANGDLLMFAVDMDTGKWWAGEKTFGWYNSGDPGAGTGNLGTITATGLADLYPALFTYNAGDYTINFGASAFDQTIPTGFKALCTANTPAPTITDPSEHFQAALVTHDGSSTAFTLNWSADTHDTLFWIKNRDSVEKWYGVDGLRGSNKYTTLNDHTAAEQTDSNVISWSGTSVTLGSTLSAADYVVYCFRAGAAGGVSNTDGTITTQVAANTTTGISLATYTGNATSSQTLGHGLSSTPGVVIGDNRTTTTDENIVGHIDMTDWTKYLALNGNNAERTLTGVWESTAPSSTVVSVGSDGAMNGSSNSHLMWCFAKTPGFIGIGSFEGNASTDGTYVTINDGASGFKSAFIMIKSIDSTSAWHIYDNKREGYNVDNDRLEANTTAAEGTGDELDITSNGFKKHPFGGSGVAQAKAR
jgi:hypothetical protein